MNIKKELNLIPLSVLWLVYLWGIVGCKDNNLIEADSKNQIIWQQTALDSSKITALAVSPNGDIFIGSCDKLYRSSDQGASWISLGRWCPYYIAINENREIFFTGASAIVRSSDNGESWQLFYVHVNHINTFVRPLAFGTARDIYIGSLTSDESLGGIYRSLDNGETWAKTNLPDSIGVWSLAINSKGHIFAGTAFGVFRSEDDGQTWLQKNNGFRDLGYGPSIESIAIHPTTGAIFVAVLGDGVYRSEDNGDTWIATPLRDMLIQSIVIFVGHVTHIFAASGTLWGAHIEENGVFYSNDNGESWKQINSGLTDKNIYVLAVDSLGYVYAGSRGGSKGSGVFRTVNPVEN